MSLILTPSPYIGMSDEDRQKQITYDVWKEKQFKQLSNLMGIKEFKPIVAMAKEWLLPRNEEGMKKTNKELLHTYMETHYEIDGWNELFVPRFIAKWDWQHNTEKWKAWQECIKNWIMRLESECDILDRIK